MEYNETMRVFDQYFCAAVTGMLAGQVTCWGSELDKSVEMAKRVALKMMNSRNLISEKIKEGAVS